MKVQAGDQVVVSQWGGGTITGIVQEVLEDVKNGRPGIDYVVPDADNEFDRYKWAYMNQVLRVL